jgi:phosphoribosylformimino-5-aminoimidazole carboxamide ribotide isomerase
MTVYSDDPVAVAMGFRSAGAEAIHVVDLEGARDGTPANFGIIKRIVSETGLVVQVGGGIRTVETIEKYLDIGVKRVILGTAAVSEPGFLLDMVARFGDFIAVGVDIKDGLVAIKGWTEVSDTDARSFCRIAQEIGVATIICTDISKDGILAGTNMELYEILSSELSIDIIASGGVTTIDEVTGLSKLNIHGAIIGKALYTGDINLAEAIAVSK